MTHSLKSSLSYIEIVPSPMLGCSDFVARQTYLFEENSKIQNLTFHEISQFSPILSWIAEESN